MIKGKVVEWNDSKGYGFISALNGELRVFLRISEHSEQPFRYDPNTYFGLIRTYIPRLSEHF
ncbi:cold shock domain-containing protein [Vibrio paracholerae]|nr:cold shock domain-containing protein [Vibrio paracholerae]